METQISDIENRDDVKKFVDKFYEEVKDRALAIAGVFQFKMGLLNH